jgi:hypothetical protein
MKKKGTKDFIMKHYGDEDSDFTHKNHREEKKRRQQKNWTRFYQEHETEYDDLEDFHN